MSEDIATSFITHGWNVARVGDANDIETVTRAIMALELEKHRSTMLAADSRIGWGAPTKQDSSNAHG